MGTIFEKICSDSGKGAAPNYETCGWISSFEPFKKTNETESTSAGLQEN